MTPLRICMLVANPIAFDGRVLRHAATLVQAGHQVTVLGVIGPSDRSANVPKNLGFDSWRLNGYPVKTAAPCEGTSYEIGGIAMIKGQRNQQAAQRYYDWLMSPTGQAVGAKANSLQVPANKTFKPDPRIPLINNVRLIKYDFEKYGKAAERRRLIERWTKEVESLPR